MNSADHTQWQSGSNATITRRVQETDIAAFAQITGDTNPVHLDEAYAATTRFQRRIAHGMLTASHISAVLGTVLPGPGAIYLEQTMAFVAPVYIGDVITTRVEVRSVSEKGIMLLDCQCVNQHGATVITGQATVLHKRRSPISPAVAPTVLAGVPPIWPPQGVTPLKRKR